VIEGQDFGEAMESDHETFIGAPFDGVFGLALPGLAKPGTISALQRLCTLNLLPQCLFSVWLNSDDSNNINDVGGELNLGEVDHEMFFGELHWVGVSNKPYWQVDVERVWFEGEEDLAEDVQALFDTGSSIISVPPNLIQDVDKTLGVTQYINGYGLLNCRRIPNLPRFNIQIKGKVQLN
jgi:Eukaryotic aspartyl protease